jgi:SAM-dependent methyltransferase
MQRLCRIRHIGQYGRFLVVKKELEKLRPADVLDAGCGSGLYSEYIFAKFPVARLVAVDLFELAHQLSDKIAFVKEDLTRIKFRDKFNLIINVDVLEPGGVLVLHTPNEIQRRILKSFKTRHQEDHVRIGFGQEQLTEEMQRIGFEIDLVKYTSGIFGILAWKTDRLTDRYMSIKLIILPLLKAIMHCDTRINHKVGNGLLIVARKP